MLQKKLVRHGNSLALVLDKPILDMLKIDDSTNLNVITDGNQLVITPADKASHRRKVKSALAEVNRKYSKALKKLAE